MPTRFAVHVVPRSARPGPNGWHGDVPRVRVRAAPTDGRANREVEDLLSDLLGCPVRIHTGHASRRKICEADIERPELMDRLEAAFGDV